MNQLSQEIADLRGFIENIENAPEWRDVSLTELTERLGRIRQEIELKIGAKTSLEQRELELLEGLHRLIVVSYRNEFGHLPYNLLGEGELKLKMKGNALRLRKKSIPKSKTKSDPASVSVRTLRDVRAIKIPQLHQYKVYLRDLYYLSPRNDNIVVGLDGLMLCALQWDRYPLLAHLESTWLCRVPGPGSTH